LTDPPDRASSAGIAFQVRASLDALGVVARNRDIGRLELGWTASVTADWAYVVAVMVTAYQANGALAVGGVGVARSTRSASSPSARRRCSWPRGGRRWCC
jgi:hypothetical protein